jgi:hypothetical protein
MTFMLRVQVTISGKTFLFFAMAGGFENVNCVTCLPDTSIR